MPLVLANGAGMTLTGLMLIDVLVAGIIVV